MNAQNLRKSQTYRLLAVFAGMKPESVKKWFSRNGHDALSPESCVRFLETHGWDVPDSLRIESLAPLRIIRPK